MRGEARETRRVLSRPHADRAHGVRRRAHAARGCASSGSEPAGTGDRAQTVGPPPVRRGMTTIPRTPVTRHVRPAGDAPPPTPARPDAVNGASLDVDSAALEAALRRRIRGEVRFTDGDRALYSTDASNYRQIPVGVVLPRDADDVVEAVAVCREYDAPIVSRGGATGLAGAGCNAAVVLDMSKYMNRVLEINWDEGWARVEPGVVLDDLRMQAESRHLTFGPDPATHNRNTLGGMIGNNSCGMHAQMAGKVEENTIALEILTYDGSRMWVGATSDDELETIKGEGGVRGAIYSRLESIRDRYGDEIRRRFPRIPRLVPSPRVRALVVLGFPDIFTAGDHVAFCNEFEPIALEGIDASMFRYMHDKGMSTSGRKLFPDGGAWLVVEFGGDTKDEATRKARRLLDANRSAPAAAPAKLFEDVKEEHLIWQIRESGLGATSKIPHTPNFYPGWEDSAVAPADVGRYLRDLQALMEDRKSV